MYIVNVSLRTTTETPRTHNAQWFRESLVAGAVRSDGLAHVFTHSWPASLEVVLFMLGDTAEVAEVKAVSLCELVIDRAAEIDLRIHECRTTAVAQW